MQDDNYLEEEARYAPPSVRPPLKPGDPGYRMTPWAPDYAPGSNWNNGTPSGAPNDVWNMNTNQWDSLASATGAVKQPTADAPGPAPAPREPGPQQPPGDNGGRVDSIGGNNINVPSSTLPQDILGLFNKQPQQTPVQSAYQDALLNFMKRGQETPTLNDSILGPQVEVYRAQQQRNQERNRRVNAERAAASGQSESGYLDNLINQGVQEQNFNTASFNANLLGGEMGKRREELQAGMQLASATGNAEADRELRARLAQVSAAMQQQSLSLQGQLGGGDLSLRLMQTLMGNDQFYDQLGINSQLGMEGLNQRALQIIMGGTT